MSILGQLKDKEYTRLLKEFKPIFGKENHIRVMETLIKINDLTKDIERRLKDVKVIKKKEEELTILKKEIIYLLKK